MNVMSSYISKPLNIRSSMEAVTDLLLNEHRSLLQTLRITRVVGRLILFGLILVQMVYGGPLRRSIVVSITTGLLVCVFWILKEFTTKRSVNRLGDLIVNTVREQDSQTDYNSSMIKGNEEARVANAWFDTYINWRHEHWRLSRFEAIERLEPVAWFVLLLSLSLSQMLLRF